MQVGHKRLRVVGPQWHYYKWDCGNWREYSLWVQISKIKDTTGQEWDPQ